MYNIFKHASLNQPKSDGSWWLIGAIRMSDSECQREQNKSEGKRGREREGEKRREKDQWWPAEAAKDRQDFGSSLLTLLYIKIFKKSNDVPMCSSRRGFWAVQRPWWPSDSASVASPPPFAPSDFPSLSLFSSLYLSLLNFSCG